MVTYFVAPGSFFTRMNYRIIRSLCDCRISNAGEGSSSD